MSETKKRLVVIDGKSVFYRGYYAMPNLAAPDGTPTGGVYGFGVMALEIVKKMNPDFVCVAWDKPKTNIRRRREIYPDYKANRKPAPPDFYVQIPILKEMLKAFGWPLYEIDDHEADDIMGTFAIQAGKKGYESILITSDKDVLQLASQNTHVALLKKGLTNVEVFDDKHLKDTLGLTTEQFVDYKSLRGDPSDNLPGVAGVGEKTALSLIADYGSIDGVYDHLNDLKPALRAKLEKDKDMAYLTKELVLLDTKVPLKISFDDAAIENLDPNAVVEVFKKYDFKTLLKQIPKSMQTENPGATIATDDELGGGVKVVTINSLKELQKSKLSGNGSILVYEIAKDKEGLDPRAIVISEKPKEALLLNISEKLKFEDVVEWLKPALNKRPLIGHDCKRLIKTLLGFGVEVKSVAHDTKIAAFLLNSLEKEQSIGSLAHKQLGYQGPELDSIAPDEVETKAPRIISAIWQLKVKQVKELARLPKLYDLAKTIEWPIIKVLAKMEAQGVILDTEYLKKMSKELQDSISDIEQSIYGYAEKQFNISSPKQLAEVLFEDLKLPTTGIKRTKSGYSTAARELAKLVDIHPIIKYISNYRELTKLKSTYVDALPQQIDSESRLHTTFSLTTAATGRLSSHDPNLQNIPVRGETGKKIRKAFVAAPGNVFVTADYSQFELRIAAVLAGDKQMIKAFNGDVDIHTQTAAQLLGISESEVTKEQRYSAKAVNFGVMYGQGVHGLSEGTSMSYEEAKEFIDKYFEIRKDLKTYLDKLKQQANDDGYVETLLGRRRPTPDVQSSNFVVREAAKRAAINMPMQGTAADIMKKAMIDSDKALDKDCKIILQIHDSMIIECPEKKAKQVANQVKDIMEKAYPIEVKLKVDTAIGKNWGDF